VVILPHKTGLDTQFKIRRARYQLKTIFKHHHSFLEVFGPKLIAAFPETANIAASVVAGLAANRASAPAVVPRTIAPPVTPSPSSARASDPVTFCECGYHFLAADSPEARRAHLDDCSKFQKATDEEANMLLINLGLKRAEPKQTQANPDSVDCWHCKRTFDASARTWFHTSHLKMCKKGAPSYTDMTPVQTPTGLRKQAANPKASPFTPIAAPVNPRAMPFVG